MTSEVAVMNRLSVALAADSASTVSGANGSEKIWNSANKLFALSRCEPVGFMFYNNASLAGVPWETLLKDFRSSHLGSKTFDTLDEYAHCFIEYLRKNIAYFGPAAQSKYYSMLVRGRFSALANTALNAFFETLGDATKPSREEVYASTISSELDKLRKFEKLKVVGEQLESEVGKTYRQEIEDAISSSFHTTVLTEDAKNALRELAVLYVSRRDFGSDYTGLVFAGFGREELYPTMRHFKMGAIVSNVLRYEDIESVSISEQTPSAIKPFAQSEMVETFLKGVSPRFNSTFLRACVLTTSKMADVVVDAIDDLDDARKTHWKAAVSGKVDETLKEVFQAVSDYQVGSHWSPIHGALVHLPKDEMANVAEALVNLNSFQKRVSMDSETVGGPIDVAVISKGDGFVWIKRKHYFAPELNPQFFMGLKKQHGGGA